MARYLDHGLRQSLNRRGFGPCSVFTLYVYIKMLRRLVSQERARHVKHFLFSDRCYTETARLFITK